MDRFPDYIEGNVFIDLLLSGSRFTWSNNQATVAMSRIIHFLVSKERDCWRTTYWGNPASFA